MNRSSSRSFTQKTLTCSKKKMFIPCILKSSLTGLLTLSPFLCIAQTIVINEIHYDEKDKIVRAEFIELYNAGEETVNLSGWYFSEGIDYKFQEGVTL